MGGDFPLKQTLVFNFVIQLLRVVMKKSIKCQADLGLLIGLDIDNCIM